VDRVDGALEPFCLRVILCINSKWIAIEMHGLLYVKHRRVSCQWLTQGRGQAWAWRAKPPN